MRIINQIVKVQYQFVAGNVDGNMQSLITDHRIARGNRKTADVMGASDKKVIRVFQGETFSATCETRIRVLDADLRMLTCD